MADNVTEGTQTPPNNEADENIAGRENQNHHVDHSLRRGLEERIEKKEEQILKMEASVFQLANYYFVFQGVILTVIINGSSSFKCKHFWLPLSLSVIGAILNFGSLLIIADRYKESLDQLDDKTLTLYQHMYPKTFTKMHKQHKKKKTRRKIVLGLSMILFLGFAALNLFATWFIPCRG
ncbi:hypothetical protein BUALT_BualtUnG0001600 [Buddleja alternifolia]|uniref:Transmembrane protein n=1 Tax=Buddleja alternifolia TaxID=168488 RepID=A0AAV6W846_9LAMI|nr:hypothetical protein BUALT_BualtUnG0001600 [Buddleja alternifolia]